MRCEEHGLLTMMMRRWKVGLVAIMVAVVMMIATALNDDFGSMCIHTYAHCFTCIEYAVFF